MKLSSSISSKVQLKGDGPESSFTDGFQDNKGTSRQQQNILSPRSGDSLEGSKDHSGVLLFGPFTSTGDEKTKHAAKGNEDPCAKPAPGRQQAEEQRPESGCEADMKEKSHSLHFLQMQVGAGSQKREKKSEAPFSDCR